MKTKFLIISLPSTGKTTLCNNKADELFNISRKPSGFVFLDFDIRYMRYVSDNLQQIRIDQTKLLISMLNSNDVIGVTGFATQFDFDYLFNCASILFKDIQLRILFVVPTLRRLGQAVYDCFMRSSGKYTSLFMGDDDISMHMYPWLSVISDVSRRYRKRLFAFDYWYNARDWNNDLIRRVYFVANKYLNNKECKNFIKCYFFSLDVGRYVQDVYRLFVTNIRYKNFHGIIHIPIEQLAQYNFYSSPSDKGDKINNLFQEVWSTESNEHIKIGLKVWFERFRYVIPKDDLKTMPYPRFVRSVWPYSTKDRLNRELSHEEKCLKALAITELMDDNFDDATDLIDPLNDR